MPVIRHGFGGPPPRAIHGAGRLNRHPCRFTPQIHVEFRPAWFNGTPKIKIKSQIKSKSKSGSLRIVGTVGSYKVVWIPMAIAGKPAPTFFTVLPNQNVYSNTPITDVCNRRSTIGLLPASSARYCTSNNVENCVRSLIGKLHTKFMPLLILPAPAL